AMRRRRPQSLSRARRRGSRQTQRGSAGLGRWCPGCGQPRRPGQRALLPAKPGDKLAWHRVGAPFHVGDYRSVGMLDPKCGPFGNLWQATASALDALAKGTEPTAVAVSRWHLELTALALRRARAWLEIPTRLRQCTSG